ncbi:MAG: hypothetical protein WDZ33_02755 [Balneolaceae bacterium]
MITVRKNFRILVAGFLASLAMFVIVFTGIQITGLAPFNIPPSAAFLYNLGIQDSLYPVILHFCYGILWAYVFVHAYEEDVSVKRAVQLALVLWLFMMVVYSPLIGWGLLGMGYAPLLLPDHPLHLSSNISYVLFTFLLHMVYGLMLGWLTVRMVKESDK